MADRTDKKVGLRLIPASAIQQRILVVRERQVMLDEDPKDAPAAEATKGELAAGQLDVARGCLEGAHGGAVSDRDAS